MKKKSSKPKKPIFGKDGYQSGGPDLSQIRPATYAECVAMGKILGRDRPERTIKEPSLDPPEKAKDSKLSARKRREASEALDILKGTGWSLPAAARLVVEDPKLNRILKAHKHDLLTPYEAYEIMEAARDTPYAAALALMLFAGLHGNEIAGENKAPLTWEDIDFVGGRIRIPASISRTGNPRIIEKPSKNLWRWLEFCRRENNPILQCASRQARRFAAAQIERPWPKDALRNSFAAYHLALHDDSRATALSIGYESWLSTLDKRYRGLANRQMAIEYFDIYPEAPDILY